MKDKIAIDVTRLVGRLLDGKLPTGVDRVSLAYLQYFSGRARAVLRWSGRHYVLSLPASTQLFNWLLAGEKPARMFLQLIRAVIAGWSERDIVDYWLINTGHSGLELPDYAEQLQTLGVKPILMVHDLIPLTHPEYNRPNEDHKHRQRMLQAIKTGGLLLCNSADTEQALLAFAAQQQLAAPATLVTHLGVGMPAVSMHTAPATTPYFVMLGTIEPRKNHLLLLNIWRDLVDAGYPQIPQLLVIGQRGWECEQIIDMFERCQQLRGRVVEIADCSDQQLIDYIRHARALLFPSFVEGFGLPLIEALQLGVPVIASQLPVFSEIAQDIPDYLSPLDGIGWRQAILDYTDADHPRRQQQINRLTGYQVPTWQAHFALLQQHLDQHGDAT